VYACAKVNSIIMKQILNSPGQRIVYERNINEWQQNPYRFETRATGVMDTIPAHLAYLELLLREIAARAPTALRGLHLVWGSEEGKQVFKVLRIFY
jgi:hypothetical protein